MFLFDDPAKNSFILIFLQQNVLNELAFMTILFPSLQNICFRFPFNLAAGYCFASNLSSRFFIVGSVRAESFTRLPPSLHPASMTDSHITNGEGTECVPNTTADDQLVDDDELNLSTNLSQALNLFINTDFPGEEETGEELLQKLATRHYYSYTAALGVTVGVGCLLLILNMLIFAGIYYQRDRDRRRQNHRSSRSNSSPSTETIPMSHRPSTPENSSRQSPIISRKEKHELPPSYSPSRTDVPSSKHDTLKKEKPPPPVRTSSNLTGGTVKKRVQIQEISV